MIMIDNQEIIELFIRVLNKYTVVYAKSADIFGVLITPSEAQILNILTFNKGIYMNEISQKLGISKAAVSKAIKKMENKGYLKVNKDQSNRRYKNILITEFGETVYKKYESYMEKQLYMDVFEDWDKMNEESKAALKSSLEKMYHFFSNDKE